MAQPVVSAPQRAEKVRLFAPILAGASLNERLWACFGALVAIGLTGLLCGMFFGQGAQFPMVVAPLGASAWSW